MSNASDPYAAPTAPLRDDGLMDPTLVRIVSVANVVGLLTCVGWLGYALREGFRGAPARVPIVLLALVVLLVLAGAPFLLGWIASHASRRAVRLTSMGVSGLYGIGYSWLFATAVTEGMHIGLAISLVLAGTCFASAFVFVRAELAARRVAATS